jgi:S-DNA-T family DNA segregation ATPase FtsK/SpoIIIE
MTLALTFAGGLATVVLQATSTPLVPSLVPLVLSSPGLLLLGQWGVEKYRYVKRSQSREAEYRAYLADRQKRLETMRQLQRDASLIPNPDPAECLRRAQAPFYRLWERSPDEPDFLELRIGMGNTPAAYALEQPLPPRNALTHDPLLDACYQLVHDYATVVDQVAITLPLTRVGTAGLAGSRRELCNAVRALLLQLATHHEPDDLKVVLSVPEQEKDQWEWARLLAHCWSDDGSDCFVVASPASAARVISTLGQELNEKQRHLDSQHQHPIIAPILVFVFADPTLKQDPEAQAVELFQEHLRDHGRWLGAYSVFLSEHSDRLPKWCDAIVELSGRNARLSLVGFSSSETFFEPDVVRVETAEQCARSLPQLIPAGFSRGQHRIAP